MPLNLLYYVSGSLYLVMYLEANVCVLGFEDFGFLTLRGGGVPPPPPPSEKPMAEQTLPNDIVTKRKSICNLI